MFQINQLIKIKIFPNISTMLYLRAIKVSEELWNIEYVC